MIIDDIPNGLGRCGSWWSFERFGIVPDILCVGKGLGGGIMPIAAMIAREEYNIAKEISLGHFTHEKSPLGCAAALAVIEYMEKENIIEKVRDDEIYVRKRLHRMKEKYKMIGDVRGLGLLWGIEFVKDRKTKEKELEKSE